MERLPEGADGRLYLAAFVATHLDKDHIQGFGRLLERITIGDLWFTPQLL
jgi:beta-lactamase superfamily II metal-dependent hydrolase